MARALRGDSEEQAKFSSAEKSVDDQQAPAAASGRARPVGGKWICPLCDTALTQPPPPKWRCPACQQWMLPTVEYPFWRCPHCQQRLIPAEPCEGSSADYGRKQRLALKD